MIGMLKEQRKYFKEMTLKGRYTKKTANKNKRKTQSSAKEQQLLLAERLP